ncbi:MAG: hypothetical protein HGA67_02310 [Candidatus Yonathbacteria bacterium]|nr:hypothetical protein [Candidatus Yonathbacteria bacterium]
MHRTILICSPISGGCGFIGHPDEFNRNEGFVFCPQCLEDHAIQVTEGNLEAVTDIIDRDLARELLTANIAGKASCGCAHHTEDGIPCHHDIALFREQYIVRHAH